MIDVATSSQIDTRTLEIKALGISPVFLYGAGVYSVEIQSFLESHGIRLSGCFVDDAYLNAPHRIDLPVESYASIRKRFEHPRIVAAFCDEPEAIRRRLKALQGEEYEEPFFIDCRFWKEYGALTREHIEAEKDRYQAVYDLFGDERSQRTFVAFINAKLLHDARDLVPLWSRQQYFPEDLPIFRPSAEDRVVDGGAYTGDTLSAFLSLSGGRCRNYAAFEADTRNAERLQAYVAQNQWSFVDMFPVGLWSESTTLSFQDGCETSSCIRDSGATKVSVTRLDDRDLSPTFIKLDIEGAEEEALKGARETILRCKPRLAISLYHKMEHLLSIPLWIDALDCGYRFALRAHRPYTDELVLYAYAETP